MNYRGGKVNTFCKNCGKLTKRFPSKSNRKFCSQKCYGEWKTNNWIPWNKGKILVIERTYNRGLPSNWRTKILERDKHKCQICGINLPDRCLHIHHIIPYKDIKIHTLNNLLGVCEFCHSIFHNQWIGQW